ncbi:MAG: amino acid permease, partial [Ignavibacteria bacterium]
MNQFFARKPLSLLLEEMKGENRLRRILGPVTLTSLGVGAIIGTGIFVLTGKAALTAGPGVMLSFVFAGIACVFAALCYAEFASMVPVAGSAYTYAYATLGELFAWIIGWDLVLEYAVGSAAVANGWSSYFQEFIDVFGLKLPDIIAKAPIVLDKGHLILSGGIVNLPAVIITFIVTVILIIGIKESARFNATMVITKLFIVVFVIAVGAFFINPDNWSNFTPFGLGGLTFFGKTIWGVVSDGTGGVLLNAPMGVLAAAAVVFFAYIGF